MIADPLHQGPQRQGKIPLPFPQPGRNIPVQQDHAVVGGDAADVGAGLDGLLRPEDTPLPAGAGVGIPPEKGQFRPGGNGRSVARRPQFQLDAGRTSGAGHQVGGVVDLLGEGHAADGHRPGVGAAGEQGAVRQQKFVFQHRPLLSTG